MGMKKSISNISKRLSIRFLLKLLVVLFVIITIFFYLFIHFMVIEPTVQIGRQETQNVMVSCAETVKSRLSRISDIASTIAYNDDFIEYMMVDERNHIAEMQDDILDFISDCCKIGYDIACVEAVDNLGRYRHLYGETTFDINLNHQPNIEDCEYDQYMFMQDKQGGEADYCCYKRNIVILESGNDYQKSVGTLYVVFKTNEIQEIFNQLTLSNNGFIALASDDGIIQVSSVDNVGEKVYYQGENNTEKFIFKNLHLVIGDNTDSVYVHNIWTLSKLILTVFIILFIFVLGLYLLFVKKYIIPVKQISNEMHNNHTYKDRINVICNDELDVIVKSANNMLDSLEMQSRKILDNQRRLYESEIQNQKSLLSNLQSQINPHFLYNTLECMRSISSEYHCSQISTMCVSLAKIFRYSIANEVWTTFREEIEIVKQYMKIINVRFGEKIEIIYDIEDAVWDKKCPKMIIQPIIENAVQHGIEKIIGKGILEIHIREKEESIYITIKDNGHGIEEEKLQEIIFRLQSEIEPKRHIGLYNVHKRLELMYGKPYGLTVKSKIGVGTEVMLKMPARQQPEERNKN